MNMELMNLGKKNYTKIPTNVLYRLPKNTVVFGFIGNINE